MASETSGTIRLQDSRQFMWMLSGERSPEIWGVLQTADGQNVKGSGGWWRTTDPREAARKAESAGPVEPPKTEADRLRKRIMELECAASCTPVARELTALRHQLNSLGAE